ncbi:hypothetical protein [uncultured Porphyromonas sp.]|jgi:hypothetical protein|uniref:hypothetical protein n=1 Tax=uncultured Porphyromonas sp. TaxID=159274 RepID=UPI002606DD74|nr:hypothetical protein [uncultured Porphyromonas sp.]
MKKSAYSLQHIVSLIGIMALGSCSQPMTQRLFFQSHRPQVLLPTDKEEQAGRMGQLSEIVSYQQKVDTLHHPKKEEAVAKKDDGLKTFSLEGVTITAERPRVKVSTLRKGKVNLTFLIKIPRGFMDERYQMVLTPSVMSGDTTFALPPVVLKGKEFAKVQEKELKAFGLFKESLVDSAKYDSVFFNQKRFRSVMKGLQGDYFYSYKRQLNRLLSYENWRRKIETRYLRHNARVRGQYDAAYNDKALSMLRSAYWKDLSGKDSTGLGLRFDSIYTPERRATYLGRAERKLTERNVPEAYRDLFLRGLTLDSLENKSLTELDSLKISRHTYDFRAIARNETKRQNEDTYRRHMVSFPLIDSAHLDQAITPSQDFVYLYSRDIEVTPQIQKKIRVAVDARVTAVDKSTWSQRGLDTLSFVISGINDLVDPSLIDRWSDKVEAAEEYKQGLERMAARDYHGALEIFRKYPDYNAAVAFAGLGDDERALIVLNQLNSTGKVEYLKALCYARQSNQAKAKEALTEAVKQESFLAFKAESEAAFADILADKAFLKQLLEHSEELE